jgi:hypothetical protein
MVTKLPNDAALAEPEALKPSEETYDQLKAIALSIGPIMPAPAEQKVAEENVTIVKEPTIHSCMRKRRKPEFPA